MSKITQRDIQAIETRQKILDSALEQFSLHGYSATTTRMINRNIGISDGLLYHYFPKGKHQILSILLETKIDEILQDMEADNKKLQSFNLRELLNYLFKRINKLYEAHEQIIRVLFKEFDSFKREECNLLTEKLVYRKRELPSILKERYENGEIKLIDFEKASDVLCTTMLGYLFSKILGFDSPLDDLTYRQSTIDYQVSLWE
ncbi:MULTISPECIES: TetR/AcrR family transcriptional regulator [unclassified Enterococcus]|uniref:TetR/AcrR family transcriptional regulator n=1 Tax=unclassified Enterococcus TaxID=2608891 RepID=UPI001556718D|nr:MULTISPECIES: TetR/AcrR family transcriptional regulator [unclassified Enterococcus]MBS7578371.1 TetR/AcrR family transcriptional regulator [Enterococcus sp. MMGLQ5-2]MBS7585555.1 TetR/AcrR family transcriptional regulator [Enterococcus sp. MMGLQ5-1]NPD13414.1 TetR/AcrR family transcriptional regulator [Enterococcus sp. MMGLQ5-1]NPD38203.1 TetR/AcrR family transcriptional regulator [Enterococcus sp. MMGLQ5-2]